MSVMFSVFPMVFGLMFCFVIGMFGFVFFNLIRQNRRNNASPRLSVPATVVAKRDHHSHRHNNGHHHYTHYYVTFQFESGDRLELSVQGSEYGLLCEGDRGTLTLQGTRYLGFEREF